MSRLSLVLLLLIGTLTLAGSPMLTDTTLPASSFDVTITVLNTFAPDYVSQILGLDYDEANDRLAFGSANYYDPEVTFCDPDTGAYLAEVAYSSPLLDFGVCLDDDASHLYLTEWGDGKLYT
ncbi:hypothetical protein K8R78_07760 [bacterium]|nr:hypothetical protein [bacterium]